MFLFSQKTEPEVEGDEPTSISELKQKLSQLKSEVGKSYNALMYNVTQHFYLFLFRPVPWALLLHILEVVGAEEEAVEVGAGGEEIRTDSFVPVRTSTADPVN